MILEATPEEAVERWLRAAATGDGVELWERSSWMLRALMSMTWVAAELTDLVERGVAAGVPGDATVAARWAFLESVTDVAYLGPSHDAWPPLAAWVGDRFQVVAAALVGATFRVVDVAPDGAVRVGFDAAHAFGWVVEVDGGWVVDHPGDRPREDVAAAMFALRDRCRRNGVSVAFDVALSMADAGT